MNKSLLTFLIILLTTILPGQSTPIKDDRANKFFKTAEDYLANKPIDGVVLTKWKAFSSTVEFTENGSTQKMKTSKLTYAWFCNSAAHLMRVYDGDLYYAMAVGPICFYIKNNQGEVYESGSITGKFSDSWPDEFYSLSPTGPIEKLKPKILDEYLEKYNLKSQYDNDPKFKREMKDCVLCWQEKKTLKMVKYVKLLNEKMK